MTEVPWLADYAARGGLRYEPDVDERWLRVWEPYATLQTPVRYEHALHLSAQSGSLTIARFVLPAPEVPVQAPEHQKERVQKRGSSSRKTNGSRAVALVR